MTPQPSSRPSDDHSDRTRLETPQGVLVGRRRDGVMVFSGVPYAHAPTGDLRFAPPVLLDGWTGELDATGRAPIEVQPRSRLALVCGEIDEPQSEDCLTVRVTVPAVGQGDAVQAPLPVLVWLHGGGYSSGAGSLPWYDGAALARSAGAIVVGVNYRLGPLGYLAVPGLSDGRAGLDDMAAALDWVQRCIPAYGGDPDAVTVVGQSAGAHSTMCLLVTGVARGRFRRAIMQSAPAGIAPFSPSVAEGNGARFVELLGYDRVPRSELHALLRSEPAESLLDAAGRLAAETHRPGSITPPFLPSSTETLTPEAFVERAAAGARSAGIDLIIGTTRDEAEAFLVATPPDAPDSPDPAPMTRDIFVDGSRRLARLTGQDDASGNTSDVRAYVYSLDWSPPGSPLGACHCLELPFVFGTFDAFADAPMLAGANDRDELDALSERIRSAWGQFTRTGRPDAGWLPYDGTDATVLHL